jgi:hypothetical protein
MFSLPLDIQGKIYEEYRLSLIVLSRSNYEEISLLSTSILRGVNLQLIFLSASVTSNQYYVLVLGNFLLFSRQI